MKVLLTHAYFLEDDLREQAIMKPYVPLGILYISAWLDKNNIPNKVFDTTFGSFIQQKAELLEEKPDILGIYCNLMTKPAVLRLMSFVREQDTLRHTKIILGGPEVRHNALNYLHAGAHMIVTGEGEDTFAEICQHYQLHACLPDLLAGTITLSTDRKLVSGPERTLIRNLDDLPMPARQKVNMNAYAEAWKHRHGFRTFSISTMRGCPYTCKWCSRAVYGGTYRRRSPEKVAEEMQLLQDKYQAERLWFVDDVFTISHRWLRSFRDEVVKRGLSVQYEIITRADRMNDEVISLLKESGCFRIWIGAESGSQAIIDAMDRRVEVTKVRDMIISSRQAGMEAGTFIMLGYPGESWSEIRQTIQHLQDAAPTYYTVTVAYPITGTPLYEEVKDTLESPGQWNEVTDRQLDFKRRHSKQFYHYAVRWVSHEVQFSRSQELLSRIKHKALSWLAQSLMLLN